MPCPGGDRLLSPALPGGTGRAIRPEGGFFLGTESFLGNRPARSRGPDPGQGNDPRPEAQPGPLARPWERLLTTPPKTCYLKIAEGCSNRCAYCTIPDIRGPFRSRDPKILVAGSRPLAARGVKELILVAQDTTAYGGDLSRPAALIELITSLAGTDPIHWIRLLYLRPERLTPRLLETLASVEKVCPYLDIPIQHASDRILKAMNRPYRQKDLRALFRRIRRTWPRVALRTTVMVGFPGEEEGDFQELLNFIEEIAFDHLGVFRYSPEEGTRRPFCRERSPKKQLKKDTTCFWPGRRRSPGPTTGNLSVGSDRSLSPARAPKANGCWRAGPASRPRKWTGWSISPTDDLGSAKSTT